MGGPHACDDPLVLNFPRAVFVLLMFYNIHCEVHLSLRCCNWGGGQDGSNLHGAIAMSPNWVSLAGFFVACGGAIAIASRSGRRMEGVRTFFHGGTKRQHQISLGVYNVTLGTGLTFQMSVGQQFGWLALLQVGSVFAGYVLLAWFLRRYVPNEWAEEKNVFAAADNAIARATGARSWFGFTLSLWLLIFFILVLAFEAYAAGNLLVPLLAPQSPPFFAVGISFTLLTVAMICGTIGGWQAVLDTDKVQIVAVAIVITVLLGSAVFGGDAEGTHPTREALDGTAWTTLAVLCLFAITTQFYSPVNWGIVSHLEKQQQTATFLGGGGISTALLAMITLCGVVIAVAPDATPLETLLDRLHIAWASPGSLGYLAGFVVVIGGVSMILSTADSAMLKLILLVYDNVLGRDSKTLENDPKELSRIRMCVIGAFVVAFVPLAVLWITKPQIIYILVAMVTGLNVLAPLTVTVPVLHRLDGLRLLRGRIFWIMTALICTTSTLGLYFAFRGMYSEVTATSIGALLVSTALCTGLLVLARIGRGRWSLPQSTAEGDPT